VGAARSGLAASALLTARGARVTLSESRQEIPEAASLEAQGIALEVGGHRPATFEEADLIVLSPGVPPDQPVIASARARGIPVISEIELASRWLKGRIVAITGTKGKSTTTTITGRMLERSGFKVTVGGNIGAPLSAQVDLTTPETLHIVEVSSFQLQEIVTFRPWIAVMMNFSPDHLDRHPSVEAYAAAKARIFENQGEGDWAVVNADDGPAVKLAEHAQARRYRFARRTAIAEGMVVEAGWIVEKRGHDRRRLIPLSAIHLLGPHLVDDVLAAASVGALVGAPPSAMTDAVDGFRGLEHAMELVAEIDGVRFVNDSKATNVESALRSIESFERGLVPIIGGRFKGGDLSVLRFALARRARAVVAIGEARGLVRGALEATVPIYEAESLEAAVRRGFELARPGGVVLLAPACASFDMFRDYAERGTRFKEEVRKLGREHER
jgi:UDP-N-acetylmuramoylalanine--D-glutamate ligase